MAMSVNTESTAIAMTQSSAIVSKPQKFTKMILTMLCFPVPSSATFGFVKHDVVSETTAVTSRTVTKMVAPTATERVAIADGTTIHFAIEHRDMIKDVKI
ncbi:hypothetical protein DMJ13_21500 [halophilic archaeon]|nr:hypothetical protein DMJ13_21500 [halophilic archaeon]